MLMCTGSTLMCLCGQMHCVSVHVPSSIRERHKLKAHSYYIYDAHLHTFASFILSPSKLSVYETVSMQVYCNSQSENLNSGFITICLVSPVKNSE